MRKAGADLTVVAFQGSRATAEQVAREVPGIDLIIVGVPDGSERGRVGAPPAKVGGAWLVEPGDRAQTVTHVRLQVDPAGVAALPRGEAWARAGDRARQQPDSRRDAVSYLVDTNVL